MNQPRVLIVDDDAALLQALPEALRLRMREVTVDTADSAAAALDRIAARDYDAIVTDIKMPGMDGLTLLAEIRGRRPDTPILMITGHGEDALAVQALRGGAYDFIPKPIDRDDFVAALYRAIRARAPNRRAKDRPLALGPCPGGLGADRGKRGGAYDFMEKPIDRDDFVAALYRAIRAHASNRRVKDRQLALERCTSELESIVEKLGGSSGRRR